ncbi:glycosyltransferase family A protein [Cohnella fermenti]|uniref:Glycosyltransferase n=1 Tax=Cohnella fermenti TaxID=2565925 RepID=A0A4S4BZT0_9BACL|nr:glycosyltransferase family A protein [Cohnella fermenti]THF80817.1 hypothetical protein E6C55_10060 [Cohnella fermenti]
MLAVLCGILVVYALGVLAVHGAVRRRRRRSGRHYVLVAGDHGSRIEWYMRSLRSYSRRMGMDVHITVVLDDSADDTEAIVRQFARDDGGVEWRRDRSRRTGDGGGSEAGLVEADADGAGSGNCRDGVDAASENGNCRGSVAGIGENGNCRKGEYARCGEGLVWVDLMRDEDVARLPL